MANVVFMDGFDSYDPDATNTVRPGIHSKWVVVAGDAVSFPSGRYSGRCLHMGDSFFGNSIRAYFNDNKFYQSGTVAFAVLVNDVARAESHGQFMSIMHGQESQFSISISNIGEVVLNRSDTAVAVSAPNRIKTNAWHFMELEYVGHASAGRASLYLDGVKVVEFTGNTQAIAPYGFNGIQIQGGPGSAIFIDDLYLIDSATRIGERRIETLVPNGDLIGNQFVASSGTFQFSMINESLVSATTYVSATAQGSKALYNFTNLSTTPDKIDAVQLNVWATKTDAATRQLQTIVKSGTTETNSPDYNLPTNHTNLNRIENKDPATNNAWTATAVNAVQAGFKISQ